ncbi:CTLH/CRA C-terminal to lish motif domain-containing protein [Gautieria morchelliformis]|nr:CTLH/CRA C-terminal to lish motif domain-containing protein [Gautieria morchelliformis]
MDTPLKELGKLEKLQAFPSSPHSTPSKPAPKPTPSVSETLDSLLNSLQELKQRVEAGTTSEVVVQDAARLVEEKKKELDEKQKEIHGSLGKLGKAIDKKFTSPLPPSLAICTSPASVSALETTVANHFVRTGQFDAAHAFRDEAGVDVNPTLRAQFLELHGILNALENENIDPALKWVNANRHFLASRSSSLEFNLHRSRFLRLVTSHPPLVALDYLRSISPSLYASHTQEIHRLITCIIYLPLSKLAKSPYADLANPALHIDLQPTFSKEYCASLGLSKQVPLRVVGDIGGGGALSRIEKGRKVMRERKSEWSQTNELPIEIPLPPENRYHSIFACPVSKEQSTEANPPMMMGCGHVVAKDSLEKLKKGQGRVKCPYCPIESYAGNSLRVYF